VPPSPSSSPSADPPPRCIKFSPCWEEDLMQLGLRLGQRVARRGRLRGAITKAIVVAETRAIIAARRKAPS